MELPQPIALCSFNPHPLRRAGATGLRIGGGQTPPSFNPHPLRRAGATPSCRGPVIISCCFNPHPLRRAGATLYPPPALRKMRVSILTRSEERVQRRSQGGSAVMGLFQSSPAPKSGCNARESVARMQLIMVSILTRSEERVQRSMRSILRTCTRCFNPHPLRRAGATS